VKATWLRLAQTRKWEDNTSLHKSKVMLEYSILKAILLQDRKIILKLSLLAVKKAKLASPKLFHNQILARTHKLRNFNSPQTLTMAL
jgi:hypothetical protein